MMRKISSGDGVAADLAMIDDCRYGRVNTAIRLLGGSPPCGFVLATRSVLNLSCQAVIISFSGSIHHRSSRRYTERTASPPWLKFLGSVESGNDNPYLSFLLTVCTAAQHLMQDDFFQRRVGRYVAVCFALIPVYVLRLLTATAPGGLQEDVAFMSVASTHRSWASPLPPPRRHFRDG